MTPISQMSDSVWAWLSTHSIVIGLIGGLAMLAERLAAKGRLPIWLTWAICCSLLLLWLPLPGPVPSITDTAFIPSRPTPVMGGQPEESTSLVWVGLWLLGWLIVSSYFTLRCRCQRRALWSESRPVDATSAREIEVVVQQIGLRRSPRARTSSSLSTPCVLGGLRPVLLLPSSFAGEEEASRQHMLLHELMHLKRRDPAIAWIQRQILMAGWFHPALWWVGRRLQGLREIHCDQDVLEIVPCGASYRSTLIAQARRALDVPTFGLGFRGRDLGHRLQHLFDRRPRRALSRRFGPLAALALWLAFAPHAPASEVDSPAPDRPPESSQVTTAPKAPPSTDGCLRLRYRVYAAMAAKAAADRGE
ncbi:MAG: M56 family metallopeptidase [Planctomycetota bacterium]